MKKIHLLLLAAASFMLASCLEIKSVVVVNKDGTATIEESMLLGAQLAAMAKSGGGQGDQLKGLVMDKEKAEERAKKLGEGVTVQSHEEVTTPDGKTGTKVVFAVADISKLKYVPFEPEQDGKKSDTTPVTFALNASTLTITNTDVDKKKGADLEKPKKSAEDIAQMKAQMAMMKPLFAGMRVSIEVRAPGGIASTDATHVNGDTISYMDIQFDKLAENAEAFASVMDSGKDGMTLSDMADKFNKVDGIKVEGKKVVKVDLK